MKPAAAPAPFAVATSATSPPPASGPACICAGEAFATRDIPAGSVIAADKDRVRLPAGGRPGHRQRVVQVRPLRHLRSHPRRPAGAPRPGGRDPLRGQVLEIVTAVKALLKAGNVVAWQVRFEISHHYAPRFNEFGLTMVTVVNREYCKKLLVMLPGQTHPEQHHQKKEETFVVLHGHPSPYAVNNSSVAPVHRKPHTTPSECHAT